MFHDCRKFHDCGNVPWLWNDSEKTFLTAEKIFFFETMKIYIKLPLLILSGLTRLFSLMVKTRDYQHMGLLGMQVQNQWKASSMTVEHLLQGDLGTYVEPTNIPLLVRGRLDM